jgi:hypothetical protein
MLIALLVLGSSAASAAPKTYVFTGKLTSNRGRVINLPMAGNTPCGGAGLANLAVMSNVTVVPAPYEPLFVTMTANPNGCVGNVPGKKITTTGAGVGGGFVMPNHVFSEPASGRTVVIPNATPVKQIFTSFRVTAPRSASAITGGPGSMAGSFPAAAFHGFKKGAWMTQTGRQGSMFTWCWGNPACAKIQQGTKPLIVKYPGGGNAFGGTMSFVISSGPNPSNVAIAAAPAGPVGFRLFATMGSQPTGAGYGVSTTQMGTSGPVWANHMSSAGGKITMVSVYVGMTFPKVYQYNYGFPWTTMTVIVRNTGTQGGNPRNSTLTARGGDTVTAMGKRNISLVAGGLARTNLFAAPNTTTNISEIGQMYLPEPRGAASLFAGALGLLAIAASRRRR